MRFKLSGGTKIGVVISVIWFLISIFFSLGADSGDIDSLPVGFQMFLRIVRLPLEFGQKLTPLFISEFIWYPNLNPFHYIAIIYNFILFLAIGGVLGSLLDWAVKKIFYVLNSHS